jgi:hypothetical protein
MPPELRATVFKGVIQYVGHTLPDTVPYMQEDVTTVLLHNQKDRWLFFSYCLDTPIYLNIQIPTGWHYLMEVELYT